MVYVDSGPATGALNPQLSEPELPLPSWAELEADGNSLDGLSTEQLATFRQAVIATGPEAVIIDGKKLPRCGRIRSAGLAYSWHTGV